MTQFIQIFTNDGNIAFNPAQITTVVLTRLKKATNLSVGMTNGVTRTMQWHEEDYGSDHTDLAENAYEALTGIPGEEA